MKACRLAVSFDAAALVRDIDAIDQSMWTRHFNANYHDGGWSGVALRAQDGDASRLYPDPQGSSEYFDTPMRAACPAIDAALASFGPGLRSARLLRLAPGSCIREHRDYGLSLESGEARLHVPVCTDPNVEFYLDGQLVQMEPGECWYLNLDLPHRVENFGTRARVHLVVDCGVGEHLLNLLPSEAEQTEQALVLAKRAARIVTAQQRLDQLRRSALADPELVGALAQLSDRDGFVALAVSAGRDRGLPFAPEDVLATLEAERQAWVQRWIVR